MRVVFLGLSVTSSWGNGHATNYRALMRGLRARGHEVLFLERDVPWYAAHRDLPDDLAAATVLYSSLEELHEHEAALEAAELVIVGSYVPQGVAVGEWALDCAGGVVAFYDIDTPVTLRKLERSDEEYLSPALIPRYDAYLSFTSGPTLSRLRSEFGARRPTAFHCLVDPSSYRPLPGPVRWDIGYLGTYSADRQPALERLLLEPARRNRRLRCVVAGPGYPERIAWPSNVERIEHVAPGEHPGFYASQRFTLNVTRADMVAAGWSPSVRLFEAAACAVPVISDAWPGLGSFFATPRELLVARDAGDVLDALELPDAARRAIGERARRRVLAEHTPEHRVRRLEALVRGAARAPARVRSVRGG